jgi:putative transport protein
VKAVWIWFVSVLREHPEMAVFLTLAIGYSIGKIKVGAVTLGAVVGVLIVGVVIGQLGIKVSNDLKTAFFLLFLFAIGYRTGPGFFSGLRSSAFSQIALTVLFAFSALGLAYLLARAFGFDVGTAGGLMAGATSESAAVGTASDAIGRLGLDPPTTQKYISNVAVGFAVTYFLGVLFTVTFLSRVAPRILRANLVEECAKLERSMGAIGEGAIATGYRPFAIRAYRADEGSLGKTVRVVEQGFLDRGERLLVPRIRHGDAIEDATPDTVIRRGDVLAIAGRRGYVIAALPELGAEVDDRALVDFALDTVDVVVTKPSVRELALGDLIQRLGPDFFRGVGVRKIVRAGAELPLAYQTRLSRADVVTLVGIPRDVARVAAALGFADRPTNTTEMAIVAATVFVGGLVGIPALRLAGVEIGLSQSVGVLLAGLVLGWLRSVNRRIPRLPEAAVNLFDSIGLTTYLGVMAISAGPSFLGGLRQSGVALVVAGLILGLGPHVLTLLAGKYVFRMHPGILLGVCCGAGTSTPSLAAVQEAARSKVPTLGYGVPYAIGNVFLALWGSVIVILVR